MRQLENGTGGTSLDKAVKFLCHAGPAVVVMEEGEGEQMVHKFLPMDLPVERVRNVWPQEFEHTMPTG